MAIIVIGALILYLVGMYMIAAASLAATDQEPASVNKMWLDLVTGVSAVLALNAGAFFGLPPDRRQFKLNFSDPETARLVATVIYAVTIFTAFIIAAIAENPHPYLTDMGAALIGFVTGVISVFLGIQE